MPRNKSEKPVPKMVVYRDAVAAVVDHIEGPRECRCSDRWGIDTEDCKEGNVLFGAYLAHKNPLPGFQYESSWRKTLQSAQELIDATQQK